MANENNILLLVILTLVISASTLVAVFMHHQSERKVQEASAGSILDIVCILAPESCAGLSRVPGLPTTP